MKKILGMVLVISMFQLFVAFLPVVTLTPLQFATGFVQTYAEEKADANINSLKEELEEETETLEGLNDEIEFIVEQEADTQETIDYLRNLIKNIEQDLQQGKGPEDELRGNVDSIKEELNAEATILEEIRDEKGAFKELEKETLGRIAELNAKIQKAEPNTSIGRVGGTEAPPISAGESDSTAKKALQEQLRLAQEDLDEEIEAMDEADEEIEILQEEIQEMVEQKEEAEENIIDLLADIKELEEAIASVEAKEKAPPTAEAESADPASDSKE